MKIYETKTAPNPRRVRMFLAEKGIDMEYVQVDIQKGENLSAEMRAKNPLGKIPILELDDGTCIAETDAIFRNRHHAILKVSRGVLKTHSHLKH